MNEIPTLSPPGAEAFVCASCNLDFAAHTNRGADGKRRSNDDYCEGWTPYRKPDWQPDPTNGCHIGPGHWRHGCELAGCVCPCHAPRTIHPELAATPSWTCGRSLANGGYEPGPLCGEPADYVVIAVDEYGRQLHAPSCASHMADEVQDASVVYPTHPVQVSLTVIEQSCWQLGRQAWRGQRRLRKHRQKQEHQADGDEAQLQLELARGYLRAATDTLKQINLPLTRRPGLNRLVHAAVAAEAAAKTMDWLIDNAPVDETPGHRRAVG